MSRYRPSTKPGRRSKKDPPQVMLGRRVEYNSPATLTRYPSPRGDEFIAALKKQAAEEMKGDLSGSDSHTSPDSNTADAVGKKVGGWFSSKPEVGADVGGVGGVPY